MKNNLHKKLTLEDKFARHFYAKHARLGQLRSDKKVQRKSFRQQMKNTLEKEINA